MYEESTNYLVTVYAVYAAASLSLTVWLARTLYATGRSDTVIPKSSYEAVAQVYAVVNELVAMNDLGRQVELESLGEPPESYRARGH